MNLLEVILSSLGGVMISSVLLYVGNRYTARKSAEVGTMQATVEQRKVTVFEFQEFTKRYDEDMNQMRNQLDRSETAHRETRIKLRAAIKYIMSLRNTMRKNNLYPESLPDSLELTYTFWELSEDDDEGMEGMGRATSSNR